jgi:hypothetical protein
VYNDQNAAVEAVTADALGNLLVADAHLRVQKFAAPPSIAMVSDVGNDQGGQVRLRVLRTSMDDPSSTAPVLRYDVFRRIDPLAPQGSLHTQAVSPELAGWEQVGTFSAYGDSEYNVVVPTLENSTGSSLYYTAFMVRAATATPSVFFDSGAENGYSVDNLSPPAPNPFQAAYLPASTHLQWGVSPAPDFATFKLYRGSSAGFTPGPANLIATTTDTGYVDPTANGSYYKISAVDLNGNESLYALAGPGITVGVPPTPLAFALENVRPNPATGRDLTVRFTLPVSAPARLELIDVAGRSVVAREVGAMGAGVHAVNLADGLQVGAGLYFVRLTQGAGLKTERVTVIH